MISVLDNQDGFIFAYIEWYVVDKEAKFQENGDYIYIHDLWIHPNKRRSSSLKHLIQKINTHPATWRSKFVYWRNDKHKRLTRCFPRERLAKIGVRQ